MSTTPKHSVSVAAVVVDDLGRVLVTRRRDNGHWEPPGGVLELEESITDGLVREVEEETGLVIEPGPLTGVYKNMPRGIVALVFRAKAVGGHQHTSDETSRVEWVDPSTVIERMQPAYAVRVTDALDVDRVGPAIRAHDGVELLPDETLTVNTLPNSAF